MYDLSQAKDAIAASGEWLRNEYSSIHTGQASPAILDSIKVESYGAFQPIKNVGSISVSDAKTLLITAWDQSVIPGIEKAIVAADLGLSAVVDGTGIRVHFPQLTEETRAKIVKALKVKHEDARISVRKERETAIKDIEAADMSDDDKKRTKENLQKMVDDANSALDAIFSQKEEKTMKI
jgi:ribosome recycling factor